MKDRLDDEQDGAASEDFGAMLEQYGAIRTLKLSVGDKVRGKVFQISRDTVFCELSPSQEAAIPKEDLTDKDGTLTVKLGDTVEAYVVNLADGIELRRRIGRDKIALATLEEARESGMPIDGVVTGVNKGGLEVAIAGTRGFCPIGQADTTYVTDPQTFVGKTLQFQIREIREHGRNIVLSRKALLEAAQREQAAKLLTRLAVGQRIDGKVTRVADFGLFVDIGGIEGLVPMSQLSFAHVERATDIANVGDPVTVEVLKIEADPKNPHRPRIGLSLKATQADPFVAHAEDLHEGATLEGKIMKLEKFGAFVELFPGVQGLVHISELSPKRVRHPSDVVKQGDAVSVRVLGFDPALRRVSLSIKAVGARTPEPGGADRGALVTGKVDRVEKFGVFVTLDTGATALLPASETGTPPNTDLTKAFPVGSEHALVVLPPDERGRARVSKKAREQAEERKLVESYNASEGGSGKSLGTLGERLKARGKKG
ncbi:MAG: S1 RNA-binding domain-containing protein [Deltaproteobacteria bacterium]|nr:S1 RNA-binding domain-containing protein [Deltaproteobacteria bacterium]